MAKIGVYLVKMNFTVFDYDTDEILVTYQDEIMEVQPPAHCVDDPVVLDMHLELAAKLKKLVNLRRGIYYGGDPNYPFHNRIFSVRGQMISHSTRTE